MTIQLQAKLILLALLATASAMRGQDEILAYRLDPGTRCALEIEIQQNTTSESLYSAEVNMFSRISLMFRVDSTDTDGLIHMTVHYSDLLLSVLAPGMGLDMNSGSGKNRLLKQLIDTLLYSDFKVVMKESGELYQMEGLSGVFSTLETVPAADTAERSVVLKTLEEAYGPNAFKGLFHLFVGYFPPLRGMRNWTRDLTYFFNTKPVSMVNRYTLSRSAENQVTVQGLGMLESGEAFPETSALGKVASSVSGSQTYDYQLDRATGWLRSCVSRQRVVITTRVIQSRSLPAGLEIPSYTETLFEVKGTIQNAG